MSGRKGMLMAVIDNEVRTCPGLECRCIREGCAMFLDGSGCRLAVIPHGYQPAETEGKRCPFFQGLAVACGEFCEMFQGGGCALTAEKIVRKKKTED